MITPILIPWIAVTVPVLAAALVTLIGRRGIPVMRWVALSGPLAVLGVGAYALAGDHLTTIAATSDAAKIAWPAGEGLITGDLAVDALGAVMLVVVGVVATMVLLYSIGYMAGEQDVVRYTGTILLFCAAMALLLTATTFVALLIGWELMGACSYLLIGFWRHKPAAAGAAMKAFLTTRVGDMGILLAVALLWTATGTTAIAPALEAASGLDAGVVGTAALLLLLGAVGKSAQFPLHIWLPDAMEGPTPVSALIHAATMVAAGVFLIARVWPIFAVSEAAVAVTLTVGAVTALGAACVATVQTDIKKVLAYSTISQLGFMFAALGVGAWEVALFHLVTHAAFKGLLFLAAGSLIHGTGTQDLREMGGALRAMPVTGITWIVGSLALIGMPPLAGFFSKDEIVASVLEHAPVAGVVLLAASVLTAFYATRASVLALLGSARGSGHAHESPLVMTSPLVVLAALAASVGFLGRSLAERLGGAAHDLEPTVVAASVVALLTGSGVAAYSMSRLRAGQPGGRFARASAIVASGFGLDALYRRLFVVPLRALAEWLADRFDRGFVDRGVEALRPLGAWIGGRVTALQTGETEIYASLVGVGFVLLTGLVLWLGRG